MLILTGLKIMEVGKWKSGRKQGNSSTLSSWETSQSVAECVFTKLENTSPSKRLQHESLILAQDERWRRA